MHNAYTVLPNPTQAALSARPNAPTNQESQAMTVIAADTLIRGEVIFANPAQILGKVEGKVTSSAELLLGAGSECKATVQATTLIVEGSVEGDVIATERLELNSTARVQGDLIAAKLVVAEGASFSGHCIVGPEAAKRASANAEHTPSNGVANGQYAGSGHNTGVHTGLNAGVKPRVLARPSINTNPDLDATLAGLESKLAGFGKAKAAAGE